MRTHIPQNCTKIKLNNIQDRCVVPSLFVTNACHITNKVDELSVITAINKPSVVVVTESWLSSDTPDTIINIGNSYNSYRLDRPTPGGGVLAYIKSDLPAKRLSELEEEGKEVLWLLLKPPRTPRPYSAVIVVGIYYSPGQNKECEREMLDYLTQKMDTVLADRPSAGILVAGDFNKLNLNHLCRRFNLRKLVKSPTRGNNILDQILTNMSDLYDKVLHLPPIGRSDHQCLLLAPKTRQKIPPVSRKHRQIKPEKLNALKLKMNLEDWEAVYSESDVDDKVSAINFIITRMLDDTIPVRTVRVHSTDKPWMTPNIKAEIKARQRAFTKGDLSKFESICVKVTKLITNAKAKYYKSKAEGNREFNPAKWYKIIYQLAAANEDHQTLSSSAQANLTDLADRLQRSFIKPWLDVQSEPPSLQEVERLLENNPPPLPSIGQVKSVLKHLKSRKATGADNIPAWCLKSFAEELAPVVHDIVVASIVQCKYPTAYKHALISPIPKVRPPTDLDNDFRQVSVLPQLAKVLEKLQLQLNKSTFKIKNNQHAFTNGRSTVSALTAISQNWFDSTDNSSTGRQGVHALFIDFRKAFDLVDHKILLDKLAQMNVSRSFWLWTRSFLEGRTQQVNLQGALSFIAPCPAGVPQGSVISPTLFNIHINDLEDGVPEQSRVNTGKYADDCTMDTSVNAGEPSSLQRALDAAQGWAEENKMKLNAKKTKDMWINFTERPAPPSLQLEDVNIERVDSFKLLGVWFQNDLKWNKHIEEITRKASKSLYCLRECRRAKLPVEVGLTTYLSKIRPVLEYGSPVWGGLPQYLMEELERVQRRSLQIIGLPHDYLPTLDERRNKAVARELDVITKDQSHIFHERIIEHNNYNYDLRRRHRAFKYLPFSGTERHKSSFIPRAMREGLQYS